MFSRSGEYAICAVIYISEQTSGHISDAREIARATGIALPYLWKILRELTDAGLLISCKGPSGGYRLARNPKTIKMEDILAAVSEEIPLQRCILKRSECDENQPCALHKPWEALRKRLDRTTLDDLRRQH